MRNCAIEVLRHCAGEALSTCTIAVDRGGEGLAIVCVVDPDCLGTQDKEKRLARQPGKAHLLTALRMPRESLAELPQARQVQPPEREFLLCPKHLTAAPTLSKSLTTTCAMDSLKCRAL